MSTQLFYHTEVDLLTQDRAQAFVDHMVKICGPHAYTFMTENKDGTWKVQLQYDENHSNMSASRIRDDLDELLNRILAEDAKRKSARVQCEIHGEQQEYWVGPSAPLDRARSFACLLRDSLVDLNDDEAKEVLSILIQPERK